MDFKKETIRKSIHISSLAIPFAYKYLLGFNRKIGFVMLFLAFIISLTIEFFRLSQPSFRKMFHRLFGLILRRHEMKDFTGATFLLFSSMLCVAFFEPIIAFLAISFLSIGDTFAALVGINFGKRKFIGTKKSLEGSLACFITTFSFALLFIDRPLVAFAGAVAATIAELWDIPVDDNVKIPLLSGMTMTLVNIFV